MLATKDFIVRLPVALDWLDKQTAKVWGMYPDRPVVLELQIAEPFYLRSREARPSRLSVLASSVVVCRGVALPSVSCDEDVCSR